MIGGAAGSVGGIWLLKSLFGDGLKHFLAVSLQNRDIVGTSELEYRKQQLAELYGPVYAYVRLNSRLFESWMNGSLKEINLQILELFRRQNEEIINILSTKVHLLEGSSLPAGYIQFMSAVTIWNIYT